MPTLIITLDGRELQRVPLTRPRTTVGRRPYNDIVMEHLAVSGEHAVFVLQPDGRVQVLDLNSTNGTYVNGRTIVSADIGPKDVIEIARYQLRLADESPPLPTPRPAPHTPPAHGPQPPTLTERTDPPNLTATPATPAPAPVAPAPAAPPPPPTPAAHIVVLDGPAAGRTLPLTKPSTTIGKPGTAVAVVERCSAGYRLTQAAGEAPARLNGQPLPASGAVLHDGDIIALAGIHVQFRTA